MNDLSSSLLCPFIKIDDKNDKKKKTVTKIMEFLFIHRNRLPKNINEISRNSLLSYSRIRH